MAPPSCTWHRIARKINLVIWTEGLGREALLLMRDQERLPPRLGFVERRLLTLRPDAYVIRKLVFGANTLRKLKEIGLPIVDSE